MMFSRRYAFQTAPPFAAVLWLLLFGLLGVDEARASQPPLPELHAAGQIRQLTSAQADLKYPVKLRGVVTYFDDRIPTKLFRIIQDDTAGIYFYVDGSSNNPPLKVGQLVEMEGETGAGHFAPVVTSHRIRILGQAPLPTAKLVSFEDLESGREDSQFVEISGIIRAVRHDPQEGLYYIDLSTGQGRLTLQASQLPVERADQLVDSEIQARGVCITHFNSQRQLFDISLLIPLPEDLVIVQPAPSSLAAIPVQPIKSVMQYSLGNSFGHRVKVRGYLTLRYADTMYIEDETNGLLVETKQLDVVPVGDLIEVTGFPAKGEYAPQLQDSIYQWIQPGGRRSPDVISPDEALSGNHDCRLVQMDATLLDQASHSKEPFLVLQANGFVFHAYMRSQGQVMDFGRLQNGSKLRVTGVCVIDDIGGDWHSGTDWRAASFRLLLRYPGDVVEIERPPWWTLTKLFWIVGLLCAVLFTAFGWVALLRRRVHAQTQIIEDKLQIEAALKERYRDLFENASDVVFTHDLQGRLTSINKAGERLLQQSRADLLRRELLDLVAEEERPAAREWLKEVANGADIPAIEWTFLGDGGQRLKMEVSSRLAEKTGRSIEIEGVARDVTARKRMEKEILEISTREQQRLGHDLHDGVCQQLAAIAYRAHIMARQLEDKHVAESDEASNISQLINESLVQTRAVARGLFPVRLEEDGLAVAVEELAAGVAKLFNVKCTFASEGTLPTIDNSVAMHLHFIAQEAIMNAAKHSQATAIHVQLSRDNGELRLVIKDEGKGFVPDECSRDGMGMGIMKYRARAIGAQLEWQSQPGKGTQVFCRYRLPLENIRTRK